MRRFEFLVLRYVPDAVKDEFVNIGIMMLESGGGDSGFADVRFTRDWRRVRCLDPEADVEMLEAVERGIREQLGVARDRTMLLSKLQESLSNAIQLSPVAGCLAEEPAREMEVLAKMFLESPRRVVQRVAAGRRAILNVMTGEFEKAGVLALIEKDFPTEPYSKLRDGFAFDFAYRAKSGELKLFRAVSMGSNADQAISLAARYPEIRDGVGRVVGLIPSLTAVVEDIVDMRRPELRYAMDAMKGEGILVSGVGEMSYIAERARLELGG